MATENIVKGIAYRIKAAAEGVWDKCSFWTHADDLEFSDGQNASTKLSAINGITDDLSCEDASIALSAAAGKQLNESLGLQIKSISFTGTTDEGGSFTIPIPSDCTDVISASIVTADCWLTRATLSTDKIYINVSAYNYTLATNKTFSGTLYYI